MPGQLQVFGITEDGRAIGLRMLAPGNFSSQIALINNSTRSASVVVAMTAVVVENLPIQQDIANIINTSRETVTRALAVLVQQGIVQKEGSRLIIVEPDALDRLVQGD